MPLQIADQQCSTRGGVESAQEFNRLFIRKMMQKQTREDVIEASRQKRQLESICDYLRHGCQAEIRPVMVQTCDRRAGIEFFYQPGRVARCRADVEHCEFVTTIYQLRKASPNDRVSAKVSVDAHQICKVEPRLCGFGPI